MRCTRCETEIKSGEKYFRTKRGAHHELCSFSENLTTALFPHGFPTDAELDTLENSISEGVHSHDDVLILIHEVRRLRATDVNIASLRAENATLREERDAMAVSLEEAKERLAYIQSQAGHSYCAKPNVLSKDLYQAASKALEILPDPSAILAVHNKRQQALGATEALEEQGCTCSFSAGNPMLWHHTTNCALTVAASKRKEAENGRT